MATDHAGRPRARAWTMALAAVPLVLSCGSSSPSSGPADTEPASAAASTRPASPDRATLAPTASPTVAGSPTESGTGARELAAEPVPLPAGTWTCGAFRPAVTLRVDGTRTSVNRFDDFFDVEQDVGSPDVVAVQIARPSTIIGRDGAEPAPGDPAAAVELLRANPGLRIVAESESRIGGLAGRQATVENDSGHYVVVFVVGPGTVSIDTGRRLWVAWFATPDGLLGVLVGGSVRTWDHALEVAEPVLESIRIGG